MYAIPSLSVTDLTPQPVFSTAIDTQHAICAAHPEQCAHHWFVGLDTQNDRQTCYVARSCKHFVVLVTPQVRYEHQVSQTTFTHACDLRDRLNRIYGVR